MQVSSAPSINCIAPSCLSPHASSRAADCRDRAWAVRVVAIARPHKPRRSGGRAAAATDSAAKASSPRPPPLVLDVGAANLHNSHYLPATTWDSLLLVDGGSGSASGCGGTTELGPDSSGRYM